MLDRPEPVGCPLEAQLGRRVCSSEIFNREELSLDSTTSGGPPVAEAHVGSFEAHQQILYTYSVWSRNSSALCTIHEPVVIEYYSKVRTHKQTQHTQTQHTPSTQHTAQAHSTKHTAQHAQHSIIH